MRKVVLDGLKQKTPMEIYQYLAKEFDFGPYFGKNPDALYDFMVPIDSEDRPLTIEWINSEVFKKKYPDDFLNFVLVFQRIDAFEKNDIHVFQFKIN